jgi:AGCS family alanine or glycine:cation symporter
MAMVYLGVGNPTGLLVLRCALLAMVIWGSLQAVATVFNTADASMGLMATINLLAIVALSGTVVKLTKDYFGQRQIGAEPRFHGRDYPELGDGIDHTIWTRD